jgi:segregation and condensation protein A
MKQTSIYKVETPIYEGPLDLLLHLIESAQLDITTLALAHVTDQYLVHMRRLQELKADEVSAFIVIAAKLVQIKSEALLPRPPDREPGEEDPGEALARQLRIYKQYRNIAEQLKQRTELGLHTYLRLTPPPKIEGTVDLSGINIHDLLAAAKMAILRAQKKTLLNNVVAPARITIREKITQISTILRRQKRVTFWNLLGKKKSRIDIVVTFLALLELIKRHLVHAEQESIFGEIQLEAEESWEDTEEFELEFE